MEGHTYQQRGMRMNVRMNGGACVSMAGHTYQRQDMCIDGGRVY